MDFGAGALSSSTDVTGLSEVASGSWAELRTMIVATAEHAIDDLLIDPIRLDAHSFVDGVGFTITGTMDNARANGTYVINWILN